LLNNPWHVLEPWRSIRQSHDLPGDNVCPYTQIQWCQSLLLTEPRFLTLGRLTCEYVVDMFSRTEEERLVFLQRGRRIQAANLRHATNQVSVHVLRYTILAFFMGSRAWASDQVADALALARELGKPSLYITMTSNPIWPELADWLRPGQRFTEILSVVCRAFHVRLTYLKKFFRSNLGR